MLPSKLIVNSNCPPKVFLIRGVYYEGGRSNQDSSFMRGVIVPPYSKKYVYPQVVFFVGGLLLMGDIIYNISYMCMCVYIYIYI